MLYIIDRLNDENKKSSFNHLESNSRKSFVLGVCYYEKARTGNDRKGRKGRGSKG